MFLIAIYWSSTILFSISATSLDNSASVSTGKLSTENQELIRQESFNDWAQWKDRYPQCDPERNSYTSPIKMESENIIAAPDMKGIFVHSKLPVDDCLSLSVLAKEQDLEMEAVTINALPSCSHQLTYISGGSDLPLSMRYFKRAVLFFTTTKLEEERSLHQVKGNQAQMEILLEFVASNKKDYTQIFLLVEAKSAGTIPDNPIFTALEPALQELQQEIVEEASGKSERAIRFKELEVACYQSEEKHVKAHHEVEVMLDTNQLEKVQKIIRNIKGITNKDLQNLSEQNKSVPTNKSNETKANNPTTRVRPEQKLEKLREQSSRLLDAMRDEREQWALDKLQTLYGKVEYAINKMENDIKLGKAGSGDTLENIKKLLRENNVGIPGESSFPGMMYDSPDAVHADLLNIQSKINEYTESTNLYNKSCTDFFEFQKEPYAAVRINQPLQISWLFPHTGGYYLYNGSNPIPECEQRETTIVFENSISISIEQLSLFQNLPSLENLRNRASNSNQNQNTNQISTADGASKLDKMIPILFDTEGGRKVWYVAKNPVFLNDDGFHEKSAHVRQGATKAIGGALAMKQSFSLHALTIRLIVSIAVASLLLQK